MRADYATLERDLLRLVDVAIEGAPTQWRHDRLVDLRAKIVAGLAALDERPPSELFASEGMGA